MQSAAKSCGPPLLVDRPSVGPQRRQFLPLVAPSAQGVPTSVSSNRLGTATVSQAVRTGRRSLMRAGGSPVRLPDQREQFPGKDSSEGAAFPGPRPALPSLGAAIWAGLFWV